MEVSTVHTSSTICIVVRLNLDRGLLIALFLKLCMLAAQPTCGCCGEREGERALASSSPPTLFQPTCSKTARRKQEEAGGKESCLFLLGLPLFPSSKNLKSFLRPFLFPRFSRPKDLLNPRQISRLLDVSLVALSLMRTMEIISTGSQSGGKNGFSVRPRRDVRIFFAIASASYRDGGIGEGGKEEMEGCAIKVHSGQRGWKEGKNEGGRSSISSR